MEVRKIVSKEIEDKKRKRNQLIVGLILIGLMVLSTAGYSFMGQDDQTNTQNKVNYNGIDYIDNNGLWQISLGNFNFLFTYLPSQTESIDSEVNLLSDYSGEPLYIYSENTEAELELYRNLDQIVLRRQYACLESTNCPNPDHPIKTCTDNFIIIKEGGENNITQDEGCVYISGKKEDLVKVTDEFLFRMLNVK